jgi:uncharacterized protein YdeI (YjbR/CyaY-like superfamily)
MAAMDQPELVVADAAAWRRWLEEHHTETAGVWLVLATKGTTDPTSLRYAEALEEALCFGWIDGQARRRDERTYSQRFTPRRARSRWSRRNVELVARLMDAGRMHSAGLAEVERARADGRWATAYAGQAAAQVPDDLAAAVAASPRAQAMFDVLTAQNRFALIYRVNATRDVARRAARVEEFVAMLERGESIHPQKRRPVDFG